MSFIASIFLGSDRSYFISIIIYFLLLFYFFYLHFALSHFLFSPSYIPVSYTSLPYLSSYIPASFYRFFLTSLSICMFFFIFLLPPSIPLSQSSTLYSLHHSAHEREESVSIVAICGGGCFFLNSKDEATEVS